jgi:MscS family membrane protein
MDYLNEQVLGNTIQDYAWVLGALLAGWLLSKWLVKGIGRLIYILFRRFDGNDVGTAEFDRLLKKSIRLLFWLILARISVSHLEWPVAWNLTQPPKMGLLLILSKLYASAIIVALGGVLIQLVEFLSKVFLARAEKTESKTDDQLVPFLRDILKVLVYIIVFLAFLSNIFQINIAALVAGLGVGGIAIALASKDSLENLLGSFTIFLDKPFAVGDLVTIDGITGTIERVGIRSTRIRTLDKSFVTVPNKKLTESNLDNLTLRSQRRARFMVGLTYNTHPDTVRAIVADIQKELDDHPQTSMDGVAHLYEFGESSLSILVQYFVNSMDWNVYLRVREEINFKVMDIVHQRGSQFAFPTRSIYLENQISQQP